MSTPPTRRLARSRKQLSDFLTYHRKKLTPAEVGLPLGGRRRTPGLRREEVAALAGVGLAWYTWFEQGRDIGVSEAFLLNVARALRLDDAECCHLFLLAHRRPPPAEAHNSSRVDPLIQRLLDELPNCPAYVTNLRWEVIAWNALADEIVGFSEKQQVERNFLRIYFTDPGLRRRAPAWHEDAPGLVAQFRCDLAAAPEAPAILAFVEEMKSLSPDFRRWFEEPVMTAYSRGVSALAGKANKTLRYRHQTLTVDEHHHLRLTVYFEQGDERSQSEAHGLARL